MTNYISNILHGVTSPKHVNRTNIALIPKVKSPTSMVELDLLICAMSCIN